LSYLLSAPLRQFVLVLVVFSSFAQADKLQRPPHWSKPISDNPVNLLHQVDDKLYRSALPNKEAVSQLKALGIVSVVNFYQKSDKSWIGTADLQEIHLPMRTRWFDDEDALDALRAVRKAQEKGAVLIHCKHGQNRTGLVAALYRMMYQDWSKEEALAEMRSFGGSKKRMERAEEYLQDLDVSELKAALDSGACSTSALAFCHLEDWWEGLANAR